ncbi:MAG: universal stress protein [Bacteroidetes bacterium]|nr:universal stress protein [Bacteroidota bacterium]
MKNLFKKILVPVDFSETSTKAAAHASYLSRLTGADMLLLHVLPLNNYYFEMPEPVLVEDSRAEIGRRAEQQLNDLSEQATSDYNIHPRQIRSRGRVANEIIQTAEDEKVDLIIMGTHGAKGFEELFLGSNAHKVVTLAKCPVITIQPHAKDPGFKNIILPIDRSPHSREKVNLAVKLAIAYDSTLHILGLPDNSESDEYAKLQIILHQVEHFVKNSGVRCTCQTAAGENMAHEALRYGERMNADLIIIMTDHESRLTGIFLGPLAKQIVNHSRIPVMSIKPHYGHFESMGLDGNSLIY